MKTRLTELAILGGPPVFSQPLGVGVPNIGDRSRLHERLDDILDRRWLTNDGPYGRQLEQRLADLLCVPHCIAMCNATLALQIGIRALELRGEVLLPSFTFIATAHALLWEGVRPVFCDVDPRTHVIDPCSVERRITPATTAILGVHLWGRPCNIEVLAHIARTHGLKLIFDAAHALGSSYRGQPLGSFGDFEVFSLHATKVVNSFEGGVLATRNAKLARRVRNMRRFGFVDYDDVAHLGTNAKMSEISAAMGLTSLDSLDEFVAINLANYNEYRDALAALPGLRLLEFDPAERSNYHYVIVEIDNERSALSRDQLLQVLWAENILARRYFCPGCHRMEPYRTSDPLADDELPVTTRLANRVLALPTGTAVSRAAIREICHCIRLAVANGKTLAAMLDERRYSKCA